MGEGLASRTVNLQWRPRRPPLHSRRIPLTQWCAPHAEALSALRGPEEKKKLFDLIKNHKNTYFLSGDRHISSIYKEKFKEKEFFEITSSGLNMAWKDNNEKDSKQIIDTINTNNFGLIKFSNRFFDVLFFDENGKKIHSSHFIIKR